MSYDALVWLLVGLGVGVAGTLMLLTGYAGLERARLGRRLRKARAAVATAAEPAPIARPPGSRLDMARSAAPKLAQEEPKPEPVRAALVLAEAAAPEPAVAVVPVAKAAEAEVAPPVSTPAPQPAAPTGPKPVQSVEALFAEAFANDRLPASEPDEKSR